MGEQFDLLRQANAVRHKEFEGPMPMDLSFRGNEMAGEVGEACNVIKKLERERLGMGGSRATVDQLAEELADVIICVDLVAMTVGIDDLWERVRQKFNKTSRQRGLDTSL